MGEWDVFEPYHLNVCGFHAYCGAFTGTKICTHSTNNILHLSIISSLLEQFHFIMTVTILHSMIKHRSRATL